MVNKTNQGPALAECSEEDTFITSRYEMATVPGATGKGVGKASNEEG